MPDIRDLIAAELNLRGEAAADASSKLFHCKHAMSHMISGERNISPQAFAAMVKAFELKRRPEVLRAWLAGYLIDRLGGDAESWLQAAGWGYPEAVTGLELLEAGGFEGYLKLAADARTGRRRLAILRAAGRQEEDGIVLQHATTAGKDASTVIRNDLRYLVERGVLSHHASRGVRESTMAGKFCVARSVTWKITERGKDVLEETKHLK